jgi:site-specific recombinase XerD
MNDHGVTYFHELTPAKVAAWVRLMEKAGAKPSSVQQRLSALRSLFSYMVSEGVILRNPAISIKAKNDKIHRGRTPVIDSSEAGRLLPSIDTTTLVGLRDRALIGVTLYTCARVSAAVGVRLGDRFEEDHVQYLILHEKGSKEHRVPCSHMLEKYLREYMQRAPFPDDPNFPLFPAFLGKSEVMTSKALHRWGAWAMVKRRGFAAYILDSDGRRKKVTNHTFRATGITTFLEKGGTLERAQIMATIPRSPRPSFTIVGARTSPRPMSRGFSLNECFVYKNDLTPLIYTWKAKAKHT